MKEIRKFKSGDQDGDFRRQCDDLLEMVLGYLKPTQTGGRKAFVAAVVHCVMLPQNRVARICAGIERPSGNDYERAALCRDLALSQTMTGVVLGLLQNPNTQWDSDTLLYHQAVHEATKICRSNMIGIQISKGG